MTRIVRRNGRALAAVFVAIAVLIGNGMPVNAADRSRRSSLDERLRREVETGNGASQRVIIRARARARAALRKQLVAHGDRIVAEHASIDALTAVVHGADLAALSGQDGILSVSTDAVVRPNGLLGGLLGIVGGLVRVVGSVLLPSGADTSGVAVPPAVLRSTLGVSSTWSGRGVGVAVIDSGLEMSSEFQGRVRGFYDFTQGGIATTPYDDYGHGTHVASTIGGSGALSSNRAYRGLAPNVGLIVFKVLDKNGNGWTSDVIRAIDFAVDHRAALGIHVINLSLGHPIYEPAASDPLVQAVERATRAGIIVVAAAGNFGKSPETGALGYAGVTSPGNAPSAITAGALRTEDTTSRSDDRIADYSSAGPTWYDGLVKPDVVAPGHNIVAAAAKRGTLLRTYPELKAADGDYMRLSGTSMAAAVTSGAVALLVEANRSANGFPARPSLTPNAVKAVLQYTAFNVRDAAGAEYDALRQGGGALNAKGAIDLGQAIDTSAFAGEMWLTASPFPWTRIDGQDLTWKQAVIWGFTLVEGPTVNFNQPAWANAVIWGFDTSWSHAVIWGFNLVWTDPQSWANAVIWGFGSIGVTQGDAVIWGLTGGLTEETTAWKSLEGLTAGTKGMVGAYTSSR
ncbi:MAG: S8 family peptidase [Vicinamibacterales bacterium]